jgi:hypothetical protein
LLSTFAQKVVWGDCSAFQSLSAGMVVNLASNDVERFQQLGIFCHYLIVAPLECMAILYLGIRQVIQSLGKLY